MTDSARLADDLAKLEALAKAPRAWAKDWTKADYKAEAEEAHKETLRACAIARRFEAEMKQYRRQVENQRANVRAAMERAERAEAELRANEESGNSNRMLHQIVAERTRERDAAIQRAERAEAEKAQVVANNMRLTKERDAARADADLTLDRLKQTRADLARLREALARRNACTAVCPHPAHMCSTHGQDLVACKKEAALAGADRAKSGAEGSAPGQAAPTESASSKSTAPAKPAPSPPKARCRKCGSLEHDDCALLNMKIAPAPCPGADMEVDKSDLLKPNIIFVKAGHCPSCKGGGE